MKNESIKTLLSVDCHAMQDLHKVLGFDFCKPFDVWTVKGRYTVNQIEKAATEKGYNLFDCMIALCTRDLTRAGHGWSCDYNLVTIKRGAVKVDYKTPYCYTGRGLDTFYAKKSFDETRKSEKAETIIFVQDRQYIKKPVEYKPDYKARFALIDFDYCYSRDMNKKYINRVNLKRLDASGEKVTREIIGRVFHNGYPCAENINQIIDKSGYFVQERRDDLKRRAAVLRADRAKAAFIATDNAAKIAELEKLIADRKTEIVKALDAAATAAELKTVYKSLSTYKGFTDLVYSFERLKEKDSEKKYNSIADFERDYSGIYNGLTERSYNNVD